MSRVVILTEAQHLHLRAVLNAWQESASSESDREITGQVVRAVQDASPLPVLRGTVR